MNMLGSVTTTKSMILEDDETFLGKVKARLLSLRPLLLIVFLPTLLLAAYFYLLAADQYQSEAHFIVNAKNSTAPTASGVGALLGIGATSDQSQMLAVPDYLKSHDAVAALERKIPLAEMFRRPGVDMISRLPDANPTPEDMLKYYRSKVSVQVDHDTGITDVTVKAFAPEDSYKILSLLLDLSEQRINQMNLRSYRDSVAMAERQMREAEGNIAAIQSQMTSYRQGGRDVDPKATGQSRIQLVASLTSALATARAQVETMGGTIRHDSPQYIAASRQVLSLQRQVAALNSSLTAGTSNIAKNLGGYENLEVKQQFAAKQYDAAAASLTKAREDAMRQQLYLVRVVNPNEPVESLYPQRGKIVLTVFLGLLLTYGIGWLILAGVREHAA